MYQARARIKSVNEIPLREEAIREGIGGGAAAASIGHGRRRVAGESNCRLVGAKPCALIFAEEDINGD